VTNLEVLDAIKGGTSKPQDRSMAIALLLGSAAVFLLVGINQWDVQRALLLVVSIFIHECGHLVAMRACRYKNLKMLFIPFLGAVASGRPSEQNALKIAIIALAGPLAGLLAAGAALLAWRTSQSGILLDFAEISVFLNGFNLLPILPLDGGHVLNEVLLARYPKAELGFRVAAAVALFALAAKFGSVGLSVIAVVLLTQTKVTYDMASAINRLRAVDGMMGGELTEEKVGRIREEIEVANPLLARVANAPKMPAHVEAAWARVNKVFPGPAVAALVMTAYLMTLLVVVPMGFKETVQLKVGPALNHNREGLRLMAKGDSKGAVAAFDKALELKPGDPQIIMNRGCARYGTNDYGGAILDITQGLAKKPDVHVGYTFRALAREAIGDFQGEIDDCDAALRLEPNDAGILAHRGYAEARMRRVASALADCNRAVGLGPRSPEWIQIRAYVKDIAGDYAGAGLDYAAAVKMSLSHDLARIRWAIDLRRQKLSDAEAELRGRAPGFQDPWMRAIGLYLTGALDEAQFVSRAEESSPELRSRHLGQAFYYVGVTHLLGGDLDGARVFFGKSVDAGLRAAGETGLAQAELGPLGPAENPR
jgi:Zn-dependent protease/Flp pilus assembly protein TadD